MDYLALRDELLAGHPDTGAYNADSQLAADQLNTVNRTLARDIMSASEIFEAITVADWDARTDIQKEKIRLVLDLGDQINVGAGTKARLMLQNALTGATDSIANLSALASPAVSRAQELGFGVVTRFEVETARTQ